MPLGLGFLVAALVVASALLAVEWMAVAVVRVSAAISRLAGR